MDLFSEVEDFLTKDSILWKQYVISKTLPSETLLNTFKEGNTGRDVEQFDDHLLTISGFKLADAQRFVYASSVPEHCDADNSLNNSCNVLDYQHLLDLSSAQQFLSYLTCSINLGNKDVCKLFPLVIFCDGHVNRKNIYMFYVHTRLLVNSALLVNKQHGGIHSSLVIQTVACTGPLTGRFWIKNDETRTEADDLYNIFSCESFASKLTAQPHLLDINDTVTTDNAISTSCFSLYHLFGESSSLMRSLNEENEMANITVEVACRKVSHILGINPCDISSVTANVSPVPGDVRSPAYSLYKEVLILEGLLNAFGPENKVKWAEREDDESGEVQEKDEGSQRSIFEKLKDVIESFSKHNTAQTEKSEEKESDDEEVINLIVTREELDFTEQTWDVLKVVESYQDLVEALSAVMVEIREGRSTRFWLHEGNDTVLGKLIKTSYQGQTSTPPLIGLLPVQILAEIGLEKLRRDYVAFFITHHLSTSARLDQLCTVASEDNVATKLTKKFNEIKKLHHIVELATHCHSFLQLPLRKIDKIIRSALHDYADGDVNFSKVFTFPLSYNEVKVYLDGSSPTLWRMNAIACNENSKCAGSACWTVEFPFKGLISPPEETSLGNLSLEDENENLEYFLTTVTESICPPI